MKSKGEFEAEISRAVIRFEKEYMGRGPLETRTFILGDLILVRLKNVLTPAEHQLANADERHRGRDLIKQVRLELLERGRPILVEAVQAIVGVNVVSLHTDISTKTGERIIVFTMAGEVEISK